MNNRTIYFLYCDYNIWLIFVFLFTSQITAIVNKTKGATALDFVFKTGMIFWTDAKDKRIYK